MNELAKIAASFGTSEPIFTVKAVGGGLDFDIKNKYSYPIDNTDPVYVLLTSYYGEALDKGKRCFVPNVDTYSAYDQIVDAALNVVCNASPLQHPKQSKLYKWMKEKCYEYNSPLSVGLIALYRYIINHGIQDTRDDTNPYAKNVIAILELMREKHES